MKTRPLTLLISIWMLVLCVAAIPSSTEASGLLERYWAWSGTKEAADTAKKLTDDTDGLDDGLKWTDNHLRQMDLDELTRERSRLNSMQNAMDKAFDERRAAALAQRSRLKEDLRAEYVAQKTANPGRSVELTLRRAKESTNYSQRLALQRAEWQSLSATRVKSAGNAASLERVGKEIERAEDGIAAGKSKSLFQVKGWLQGLGKVLDFADFAGAASQVAADAWGAYQGEIGVQDVVERAGWEVSKRYVVGKAGAIGAALGTAGGVFAPVAIPVLAFGASKLASNQFDATEDAMDRRREKHADERARQLYAMEPEELARRRAENRARSQRENAEAAALAQRQPKGVSIDQLRSDVQACYARWDEEKKKEQQAQAAIPPPAPDIGAAMQSVGAMITSTLSASTLNSMLSPDLQAALASVKSLLQPPAAPPVPTTPPPAVIATLQQQAASEISTVVVQQLQASTKAETTAKSQPVPSRKSAVPIQTTQSKESSSEDLDEIIRQIRIKAIQAASDAVTKTPR